MTYMVYYILYMYMYIVLVHAILTYTLQLVYILAFTIGQQFVSTYIEVSGALVSLVSFISFGVAAGNPRLFPLIGCKNSEAIPPSQAIGDSELD